MPIAVAITASIFSYETNIFRYSDEPVTLKSAVDLSEQLRIGTFHCRVCNVNRTSRPRRLLSQRCSALSCGI